MKKFILISFGFLGWAFYEMSGGDEFEPASVKLARLNPVVEKAEAVVADAAAKDAAVAGFVDTDPPLKPEVTRVSLNLATVEDILRQDTDISRATQAALAEIDTTDDDTGVPRNVGTSSESASTPAIIPSLIVPNIVDETEQVATLTLDVRTVSGNRVNVRGGPGTDYGVVGRLVRGDAVEVLEDTGNGWVRMRPLDGGDEGWMADFLLTSG